MMICHKWTGSSAATSHNHHDNQHYCLQKTEKNYYELFEDNLLTKRTGLLKSSDYNYVAVVAFYILTVTDQSTGNTSKQFPENSK